MQYWKTDVPTGATICIGTCNDEDFVGVIEPAERKRVTLHPSIWDEDSIYVCESCEKYVAKNTLQKQVKNMYKTMFLIDPQSCVDAINTIGLKELLNNAQALLDSGHLHESYYIYGRAGSLTSEYFINGLVKWGEYEYFVKNFVETRLFCDNFIENNLTKILTTYDKCQGYLLVNRQCPLNKFYPKTTYCYHNDLLWIQETFTVRETFRLYDTERGSICALPNVYGDGVICWGEAGRPKTLVEAINKFFTTPFNSDLLLNSENSTYKLLEGYGFDYEDFIIDSDDNDDDLRYFRASEVISIINDGGENDNKGDLCLDYKKFDIPDVRSVLVISDGRKINDFAELISEHFLTEFSSPNNLYLFLISNVKDNVWQVYLPTDYDDGEYLELDLNIFDLSLEELNEEQELMVG